MSDILAIMVVKTFLWCEFAPTRRNISFGKWDKTGEYKKYKTYNLYFPYVVFIVNLYYNYGFDFASLKCYFRNEPLSSLEDDLCSAVLPNISKDGSVCLDDSDDFYPDGESLSSMLSETIDQFWSSVFNCDIDDNADGSGFQRWQKRKTPKRAKLCDLKLTDVIEHNYSNIFNTVMGIK